MWAAVLEKIVVKQKSRKKKKMAKGERTIPEIAREKDQKYLGGNLKKTAFSNQINIVPTGHRKKDNLKQPPISLKKQPPEQT